MSDVTDTNCIVASLLPGAGQEGRQSQTGANAASYQIRKIPMGCADIAHGLGLRPEDTFFDFEWVTSGKNGPESTCKEGLQEYQSILPLVRGGATGVTLKLHDGLLGYLRNYVGVTNVLEVTDELPSGSHDLYFPEHSIVLKIFENAIANPELRGIFNGKTYCACLPVREVEDIVGRLGGQTLITESQTLAFNSKARTSSQAAENGYLVAPFALAHNLDELEFAMAELQGKERSLGLDPATTKCWVKFDNLAGGDGVLPFNPQTMDMTDVRNWITTVLASTDTPENQLFPIVMDIDIGALPGVKKILGNFNVQGICGEPGVTITGTTMQNTKNGVYLGGKMPASASEKSLAREAFDWAAPVLIAAQAQGYRGYAGIDVIMVEGTDGEHRGYILEMNGRLNCSTSLLSVAHWVEQESGMEEPAAQNLYATFEPLKNWDAYEDKFGDLLYRGAESDYTGIVPVYLDFDEDGAIHGAKLIAIAPDQAAMTALEARHTQVLQTLQPAPL